MSAYEYLSPESYVAKSVIDGSLFAELPVSESKPSSVSKLIKSIAAIARLSRRNASVGAPFAPHFAIEA